ncbi:unnamed protein product [Closterium sp. NIES-65]|nr:unnamed protein product [Closterium sp. NIES-65]CAI6004911.1 unnamed protein product [Closterium sp. NIES-65]
MYALSTSAEGACHLCVPPDPGIQSAAPGAGEAAALGASASAAPGPGEAATLGAGVSAASGACESAPSGTASTEAMHTFTLDSGASRCFFRDRTALEQLPRPVAVSLADPSRGPVLATSTTALPCPAVPSGTLSGLDLPSFSTNLVAGSALQDAAVHQFTPAYERVTHYTCAQTGRHLATFTRQPGSDLYTLTTESPQVAASVSASGQLSLPPLPPSPAPPCLPCVEGRQRATPHSSEFPPTEAPLQTLHMDVWGPARVRGQGGERYFLLVVDDYTRYTTVFPMRTKGEVPAVLILWIRTTREGIEQTFTLPASPLQNGVAERRIGLVMEVARTSLIHAAAPHFLWPFAVRYAAHQLNLWPRVSVPETSPTLRWTGAAGDASVFSVWGSRAFVRDTSADKLSSRAVPCVFLGFVPDAPGWQFYHPTSRRVFPSQDVTFDESVPFYRLFPYRTAPLPPPPLFLTPGAASVDPLPPQGPARSGVSQVDPVEPVKVAVDSGPARGTERAEPERAEPERAEPGGAGSGGTATRGAEPGGAETRGAEPGGAKTGGVVPGGAESGGPAPGGAAPGGVLSSQQLREWYSRYCHRRCGAVGAGGATGAGAEGAELTGVGVAADPGVGAGGAGATGPGGARAGGTGAAGTGGATRAAGAAPAGGAAGAARGTGATGAAGGAARTGAGAAGGTGAAGGAASAGPAGGAAGAAGGTGAAGGAERVGAAAGGSGAVSAGTHQMALRPSTAPQRVPLPSPPASSLLALAEPESDSLRAASPTVTRLQATAVTYPSFESAAASALVAELVDFAAHCRLDYAASLVAESESESVCPPSVGGECALGTDVLEDRQEEFECFAALYLISCPC